MYLEPPFDPCEEPGTEHQPALAEQLAHFVQAARGAFSSNTERALRSDLAIYGEWCAERGERALPANPETVAAFVDAKAESRAPATVRRYVTSLVIAHRALGLEKTLESPLVRLALKRMHRRKGRRQDQATGLTWPLRQRLLEAAGDRLIDDRNRALLAVAYDAMLRRAELTSLEIADLLEELQGDGSLLVRRSKTDAEGRGEIVWVGPDTVRLVNAWLDQAGSRTGGCSARSARVGGSVRGSTPAKCRASSRRWRARPACRKRWPGPFRGTAPGWARLRTWSPRASSYRRFSTPGGGSPPRW